MAENFTLIFVIGAHQKKAIKKMKLSITRSGLLFGIEWLMNKCQKRIYIIK